VRRKAREVALKVLFQVDVGGADPAEALAQVLQRDKLPSAAEAFARGLVEGTLRELDSLDRTLAARSREWRPERMAAVDRNILRLACYEMRHCPDVPPSVAINEAVELAKKYSTTEAARFINGVLGQLARGKPQDS